MTETASGLAFLLSAAASWRDQDPDDVTRAEVDALIAGAEDGSAEAGAELRRRFGGRLGFGTAGLRGAIGAGPNRMNRVLVGQAAAGLGAWLLGRERRPSVVIGYDGRTNSDVFARDTAELMAGAGIRAILLPRMLPTPVLAFAVRELGTSAGVMVTASHNPAADNGYKVYLGGAEGGCQITAPVDAEIAAEIDAVAGTRDLRRLPRSNAYEIAGEHVVDEYVRRTAAIAESRPGSADRASIRFVYTAMHGVGWATASRVFTAAGFEPPMSVPEQQEPDAAFPTVAFPNPEEPGALDRAVELAGQAEPDLIVANDPDADRLAIAVPQGDGEWRRLSGNEVGWLLGWRAAERLSASGSDGTLATSVVSSPALGEVARRYRLHFVETLTGFKWISRTDGLAYGYEEALGYLVDPAKVRDKDGISAAVDFLALASDLKASGRTVDDRLLEFAAEFGAYASSQLSLRVRDLDDISRVMGRLRQNPPAEIGRSRVDRLEDFADGFPPFPPTNLLRIWTEEGSRIIVRPSGTEPKLKVYIDASSSEGTAVERRRAAQAAVDELEAGMRELLA